MELILENWRNYLKEEKEKQLIEEGWKDWLLATVIGASSILAPVAQAKAAAMPALDTIELSTSALQGGEDPTALRKKIVRSRAKRAKILAKYFDKLMSSEYFKELRVVAEKNEELMNTLFDYVRYPLDEKDIEKAKKRLWNLLNQEKMAWTQNR